MPWLASNYYRYICICSSFVDLFPFGSLACTIALVSVGSFVGISIEMDLFACLPPFRLLMTFHHPMSWSQRFDSLRPLSCRYASSCIMPMSLLNLTQGTTTTKLRDWTVNRSELTECIPSMSSLVPSKIVWNVNGLRAVRHSFSRFPQDVRSHHENVLIKNCGMERQIRNWLNFRWIGY